MELIWYLWCALVGLGAGILAGWVLYGRGFSISGDILFGVTGAVILGAGFRYLGLVPESGLKGVLIMAAIGAIACVVLRRTLRAA